jgi:hypothetical protein
MRFEKVLRVGRLSGTVVAEVSDHGDVLVKWNGCAKGTDSARLVDGLAKAESDVVSRLHKTWQKTQIAESTLRTLGYELIGERDD